VPIRIEPLTDEFSAAVSAFNQRLIEGGLSDFLFPEDPSLEWLPYPGNRRLYRRPFVAIDDQGLVRGGYILKQQDFVLAGECRRVGFLGLPLSEGVVNQAYASLGPKLLLHALKQSPLLFCLGMGSTERPLPRLLKTLRWRVEPVPLLFYVVHGSRFFREIPALRSGRARSAAAMVAAFTGMGHVSLRAVQLARTRTNMGGDKAVTMPQFGGEIEEIWSRSQGAYRCAAVRDLETVQVLYDDGGARFHRLKITHDGSPVGWAVMLDTQMRDSSHFGNLRVGTVVDCDAVPGYTAKVALATRNYLSSGGVDVIVTNQSHATWIEAYSGAGFLRFPSNYIFAACKDLSAALGPGSAYHLTRGDGDGPIHL
jgi:hypothetical protein